MALRSPGARAVAATFVTLGLGYSVTVALMPAIFSDMFRGRSFGTIFGTLWIARASLRRRPRLDSGGAGP